MRWAGFLRHMEPDMVRRILKGLKLDNETVDNGKVMAGAAQAPLGPEKAGIRRFLSRMTPYQFDGCLRLKALDKDPRTEEIRRLWEEIEKDGDCVSLKELAVGGGDLLAAGMEGKEIGETLRRLLELVLEDSSLNRRDLLLEKLRVILRRSGGAEEACRLCYRELVMDPDTREVLVDGRALELTAREFELLHTLLSAPGRVFTREMLLGWWTATSRICATSWGGTILKL